MARMGITKTDVRTAVISLEQQGRTPSPTNLRLEMGKGSFSTISPLLREVLADLESERQAPRMPEGLTAQISEVAMQMWLSAWKEAGRDTSSSCSKDMTSL